MVDGHLKQRDRLQMMSTGEVHALQEIGVSSPEPHAVPGLGVGEVGYLITGAKNVRQSRVGDTVTSAGKIGRASCREGVGARRGPGSTTAREEDPEGGGQRARA